MRRLVLKQMACLPQADVDEILAYESKVTYTKRLDSIVNGTPFVIEDSSQSTTISEPQPLQDVLPGEEDFLPEDTTLINEPPAITELPEEKPAEVQDTQSSAPIRLTFLHRIMMFLMRNRLLPEDRM